MKKARILPQLADAEFLQVQNQLKADNAAEAGAIVKQMAAEAAASHAALDAKARDPENHRRVIRNSRFRCDRRCGESTRSCRVDDRRADPVPRSAQPDGRSRPEAAAELFPKQPDAGDEPAPTAPKP